MWITTVTVDLNSLRAAEGVVIDTATFGQKITELQTLDGHGKCVPGWANPDSLDEISAAESITIKRSWNFEQHARTHADLLTNTFGEYATVTVEQQV